MNAASCAAGDAPFDFAMSETLPKSNEAVQRVPPLRQARGQQIDSQSESDVFVQAEG
jgi:hypothetical protein